MSKFITVEELGQILSVSTSTVRLWVKQGDIPRGTYINVGKTYRFDPDAVVAALQKNDTDPKQLDMFEDNTGV